MNEKFKLLALEAKMGTADFDAGSYYVATPDQMQTLCELIVRKCINREELLGAIARGWCSEKNSHKTMDPDLALAIFDEVERQIKQQFGIE